MRFVGSFPADPSALHARSATSACLTAQHGGASVYQGGPFALGAGVCVEGHTGIISDAYVACDNRDLPQEPRGSQVQARRVDDARTVIAIITSRIIV